MCIEFVVPVAEDNTAGTLVNGQISQSTLSPEDNTAGTLVNGQISQSTSESTQNAIPLVNTPSRNNSQQNVNSSVGSPSYSEAQVIVFTPEITIVTNFGPYPTRTKCPQCEAEIITTTKYKVGTYTWVICLILCLVGCYFGCCLLPFCLHSCKDVIHTCPSCNQVIGRWKRE